MNRFASAVKAFAMTWSNGGGWGSGSSLYGYPRFDNLTDPWPRNACYDTKAKEAYLNAVAASCAAWMKRVFPSSKIGVWSEDGAEPVANHKLTKLFKRPNPTCSGGRLWQCVVDDWVFDGNGYLRKERSNGGEIIRLWHIPACKIEPRWPEGGAVSKVFISHYEYGPTKEQISPEDIIHFRFGVSPENERKGWSPLLAGLRELAVLNKGADYRATILDKTGVPPYMATPKDTTRPVTPEVAERLKMLFRNLTKAGNTEALMVPTVPMEFERLGFSPQDLDMVEMMGWDSEVICSLMGLNSMVVGLPSKSKTYSNFGESLDAALDNNLVPTQDLWAEELTVQLLPDMGNAETEYVGWDRSKVRAFQEDENKKCARALLAFDKKLITKNEARDRWDTTLEDVEGGDEFPEPPAPLQPVANGKPGQPESSGDAAAQRESSLNGRGITEDRFKSLAGVWGE